MTDAGEGTYNFGLCEERHDDLKSQHENYRQKFRDNDKAHGELLKVLSCIDKKLARVTMWAMVGPAIVGAVIGAFVTKLLI